MATPYHANGLRDKSRLSPLPSYSNTFFEKKSLRTRPSQWTATYTLPLPLPRRLLRRGIKIVVPLPHRVVQSAMHSFGRKRTLAMLLCTCLLLTWTLMGSGKRPQMPTHHQPWPSPTPSEPSTLVFGRKDLQRVWEWEILSGHYPSSRKSTSVSPPLYVVSLHSSPMISTPGDQLYRSIAKSIDPSKAKGRNDPLSLRSLT